jgi:hypothetical protein
MRQVACVMLQAYQDHQASAPRPVYVWWHAWCHMWHVLLCCRTAAGGLYLVQAARVYVMDLGACNTSYQGRIWSHQICAGGRAQPSGCGNNCLLAYIHNNLSPTLQTHSMHLVGIAPHNTCPAVAVLEMLATCSIAASRW